MKNSKKRAEIMNAAMKLFAEKGFHQVPMSMIAKEAKVAVGTIYLYFLGKDELINDLFHELREKLYSTLSEGCPADGPIKEQFLHITGHILRFFIKYPIHYQYLEQFINSPYGVSMRRDKLLDKNSLDDIFSPLFEKAIADHIIKDIPITGLFSLIIGPLVFLVRGPYPGFHSTGR